MSDDPPGTDLDTELYPGGFFSIVARFERKQRDMDTASDHLPEADCDFAPFWEARVAPPPDAMQQTHRYSAERKRMELQRRLVGAPEIFLLHGMLIAMSRRESFPARTLPLFFRLWREEGPRLAAELPVRWLISAATTFADHGENGDQRALGMGLSVLFDMMKLHDSERRLSGRPGDLPFTNFKSGRNRGIIFGLPPYSFRKGDMDQNLLARLWKLSERDPTMQALAQHMLRLAANEPRGIFGRVQAIRRANAKGPRRNRGPDVTL